MSKCFIAKVWASGLVDPRSWAALANEINPRTGVNHKEGFYYARQLQQVIITKNKEH